MTDENQSPPFEHNYSDRKELLRQSLELMKELLQLYARICCEIEETGVNLNAETRQRVEQLVERIEAIRECLDANSCEHPEGSSSVP